MSSVLSAGKKSVWRNANRAAQVMGAVMAIFTICAPLFSQGSQGTITGGVFDQSGGALAGAMVIVTDVARGISRSLVADAAGQYVAPSLNPGTYSIRAEAKGFKAAEHNGVLLEVGQNLRVDLTLQPGEQNQTITVSGEVPAINTTDAVLGGAVSNESINALPLNGRNFERLLQLRPGVVSAVGAGSGATSTNGRRQGQDLVLVDGVAQIGQSGGVNGIMNVVYRGGDSSSLLPIDAIQEFNTEQNPKAEYGLKDGSVVNVGIKSGTNGLHGTAYAFGRDASATDAPNYFTGSVTPATVEQFGATAGGRVIKDKLFWFASYEGLRTTLTGLTVQTIPSDCITSACTAPTTTNLATNLPAACIALGGNTTPNVINPLSAQLLGLTHNLNGAIGDCAVAPASSSIENLYPFNPNASPNFSPALPTTGPLNNGLFKGDYTPGPHHRFSGLFYMSKAAQTVNSDVKQLLPQWEVAVTSDIEMYDGAWTWTPNSTLVNDLRVGYSFLNDLTLPADVAKNPANPWPSGYGMNTGVNLNLHPLYGGLPLITIGGIQSFLGNGTRQSQRGPEGDINFRDSVSYLKGKHAFKFGADIYDIIFDGNTFVAGAGQVKFTNLTQFLQGTPSGGSILLGNPQTNVRAHWYGIFFQDDWRLTPRLTLNLGVRYDYDAPPTERNNYLGAFNPFVNPSTTSALQQVGPGAPIKNLYNPDLSDISPRFGLAWDVKGNGKTVVRAGASIIRLSSTLETLQGTVPFGASIPSLSPPLNTSGTAANDHTPVQQGLGGGQIAWNLAGPIFPGNSPVVIAGQTYTGVTCTATSPCSTNNVIPNYKQPAAAEWNLDVQHSVTNSLTIDVAYVGNHGFKETSWVDLNQPALGSGWNTPSASLGGVSPAANCIASAPAYDQCGVLGTKPQNSAVAAAIAANEVAGQPFHGTFPYLSYIIQAQNGQYSNYDGLQVTANARAYHGLSFLTGYSFAHSLDMNSARGPAAYPLAPDGTDFKVIYSNGNNDIRHRLTFSPTYAVPGMKAPAQMLKGWTLSGILTLQSGLPWGPLDLTTTDLLGTGENNAQPNIGGAYQAWNYTGPRSAFKSGPTTIPLLKGSAATATCATAATAPYGGPSTTNGQLALASLANLGCYAQGAGILTPPAYGTIGNANRNIFRAPAYYNVDFSVSKLWSFRERYSAQFRVEFFNFLNRADFPIPGNINPASSSQFGCSCTTPDSANPVLGSGGPRHIQFGLKLAF